MPDNSDVGRSPTYTTRTHVAQGPQADYAGRRTSSLPRRRSITVADANTARLSTANPHCETAGTPATQSLGSPVQVQSNSTVQVAEQPSPCNLWMAS